MQPAAHSAAHGAHGRCQGGPAIIEALDVHISYGPVAVLDGATLAVGEGEWVAVSGPSGSGKSTLLGLLAALDHPDGGTIRFRGRDLAGERRLDRYRRLDVGLVFQLHNLIPHLDARANVEIAMLGAHRSRAERHRRAAELLEVMDLAPYAHRRPAELSGGERQRVAVARALANRPALLLADEPTGSLDPASAANVVEIFARLHRSEGTSIVMVTHDAAVAAAADRTVTLVAGRIVDQPEHTSRVRRAGEPVAPASSWH
jgi:ABC-type lipoprotein export system ATPase subunit